MRVLDDAGVAALWGRVKQELALKPDADITAYVIRLHSNHMPLLKTSYRYRILFTSADNNSWVPANSDAIANGTSVKNVNQNRINPFGRIVYYSDKTARTKNTVIGEANLWTQYFVALGYSFNTTGAALELDIGKPVYVKAAPQSDGSAIIDATTPYVQELPSVEDGKIYIFLGVAYSATNIDMIIEHPVYYYRGGAIRLWTGNDVPSAITDEEMDAVLEEEDVSL